VRVEPTPGQSEFRLFRSDSGAIAVIRGPDSVRLTSPNLSYTFRVEDHVAAGLRGVAGAELSALEPELADYFRNVDEGLLVLRIAPDTPADRAGLRPGDVVIAADGRRVETVAELRQIVALPTANAVALRVIRRGRTLDLTLRRN
jgi:S1-C subfamily serine protease